MYTSVKKEFEQSEKAKKLEQNCNGFKINRIAFIRYKTTILEKNIEIENNKVLKAAIGYITTEEGKTPVLYISVWTKGLFNILEHSVDIPCIILGKSLKRKSFKLLKEYSNKINNDYILKMYNQAIS